MCEFPDRIRRKLENDYYERGEIEIINEIKVLLNNYNYVNKRTVRALLTYEKKHTCKRKYNTHV